MNLTESQLAALKHVTNYARSRKDRARALIRHVLRMSDIAQADLDGAVREIKAHARVALHFHPDRPDADMKTVAEGLLESGVYRSQFETQLSNGSVSAYPGGERDLWEQELFGGAYQEPGSMAADRPKYGALDLMRHSDGPSPRFGSCYFLLAPAVSERCTFTYLDSYEAPDERGTYEEFDEIMAALLVECFTRDFAIGEPDLTAPRLIERLRENLDLPSDYQRPSARNLNHYIEAQVHGDVSLASDVESLVADPSFSATPTGEVLGRLCARYGISIHWHRGFALDLDDVPSDFRGPTMPSLAARIAPGSHLDVGMIGEAAMELKRDASIWADRGSSDEVLQELKLLWHCLVKYGLAAHGFMP